MGWEGSIWSKGRPVTAHNIRVLQYVAHAWADGELINIKYAIFVDWWVMFRARENMQFKKVKKEIINCKKRDFAQTCRFYAKNWDFLQIERNVVQKSTRMHKFWSILKFVSHFCHLMLCFKRSFSKKKYQNYCKSKFVLYGRFTPLTRPFYKFSTEL